MSILNAFYYHPKTDQTVHADYTKFFSTLRFKKVPMNIQILEADLIAIAWVSYISYMMNTIPSKIENQEYLFQFSLL